VFECGPNFLLPNLVRHIEDVKNDFQKKLGGGPGDSPKLKNQGQILKNDFL
jgi:hypothetical protein